MLSNEEILEFLKKNPETTEGRMRTLFGTRFNHRLERLKREKKVNFKTYGGVDKFWYVVE